MTKREAKREAWTIAWLILDGNTTVLMDGNTPVLGGYGSPPSEEDEERFRKAWQEVVDSVGKMVR